MPVPPGRQVNIEADLRDDPDHGVLRGAASRGLTSPVG
jgi:hypothetical protein